MPGVRAILLTSLFLLAGAATVGAQVQPDPGGTPRFAGGCLDSRDGAAGIPAVDFEGWRFDATGGPEPIQADNLDAVGALGAMPLFAGRLAERPVVDLWVPVCQPADHYQLYTRSWTARAAVDR
ncbi:MAG TPA: hypothetical protein VFG78_09785 [Gemmatimonadota bacterium]|nr:hypothetical protein [Gemmatimonadota bacterium]